MKAKRHDSKEFVPFDVTIAFETEDDLFEMWHRLNEGAGTFKEAAEHSAVPWPGTDHDRTWSLWTLLDAELKRLGIRS